MSRVEKSILFEATAIVTCIDSTDIVNKAIDFHKLKTLPAIALGKLLTMGAFLSSCLKGENNKFSFIINSKGKLSKIVVSGESGGKVKGYIENTKYEIKNKEKYNDDDLEEAIGIGSELIVIKDFGLKQPYNAFSPILSGDITSDFEYYYAKSEQLKTWILLDINIEKNICKKAGAIIIQPMPNCKEEHIVMLEDTVNILKDNISNILKEKSPKEIIDFYFEFFQKKDLEGSNVDFICCNKSSVEKAVLLLSKEEALNIIKERGSINVNCQFCNKTYSFDKDFVMRKLK